PIAKADLFYHAITANKFRFFLKRDQLPVRMVERETEKVTEPRDHAVSLWRIFQDERRDRMEGVEKKMRMKLHLQSTEPGLGELGLERRLLQLAGPESSIVEKSVHRDNDQRGDNQIDVEAETEVSAVTIQERGELSPQPRRGR